MNPDMIPFEEGDVMPEYRAPGVFVEEVSFRSKAIEGVSTTRPASSVPAATGR